ncbi:MAG: peptidase C69 family protein [Chloroflexota bacterium]
MEHAVEQGWCRGAGDFNFARAYGDWQRPLAPREFRYQRGRELLARAAGHIDEQTMLAHLRDHYEDTFAAPRWSAQELLFPSLCMHGSAQTNSETASGLVAVLREEEAPLRVTLWHCFSQPCLNAFHPLYLGGIALPEALTRGERAYDADSPWWACERLQRRVDADPRLAPVLRGFWRALEARWQARAAGAESVARRLAASDAAGARAALGALQEAATAELLAAARGADELLDVAAASLGSAADPLQPDYLAALNAEVGLV